MQDVLLSNSVPVCAGVPSGACALHELEDGSHNGLLISVTPHAHISNLRQAAPTCTGGQCLQQGPLQLGQLDTQLLLL